MKNIYSIFICLLFITIGYAERIEVDFSKKSTSRVSLAKGAKLEKSRLKFPQAAGFASLKNTKHLDFSNGGTMMMVVKVADFSKIPLKSRFLVQKQNSFLFGITGGKYNFSLCNNGKWSIATIGGIPSEDDDFVHIACVARKVNNSEQSEVGFYLDVYINGEKIMNKYVPVRNYVASQKTNILFNSPNSTNNFNGEIANFVFTTDVLSASEIALEVKKHPLVKVKPPAGIFEISKDLSLKLNNVTKVQKNALEVFTGKSLHKAALMGAPTEKIYRGIKAIESIKNNFTVAKFNAIQKDFALLATKQGTAFLILGNIGSAFPLVDIFDAKINQGILGSRSNTWLIRYHLGKDKYRRINDYSKDVTGICKLLNSKDDKFSFVVTWQHKYMTVVSNGSFSKDGLEMDLTASAKEPQVTLANCRFPYITLQKKSDKDYLVTPRMSGKLIPNPTKNYEYSSKFPRADNTMQFQAYYGGKNDGVYIGLEDPNGTYRHTSVFGKYNNLHIYWQTEIPVPEKGKLSKFVLGGNSKIALYQGQWYEAGQMYKNFLKDKAAWWIPSLPRTSTPEWFRNNSIWILAGVFPSRNESTILYLRKYFEQPIGVHLVRHTGTRIWPHFDKITAVAKKRTQTFQNAGIKVVAYSDPRLYSQRQLDGVTMKWEAEPLKWAVKDEQHKPVIEHYGDPTLVLCPANKVWQQDYLRICLGMGKNGFNGIYHDQLPCGQAVACFSKEHNHLVNDPTHWIQNGYKPMYSEIRRQLDKLYPGMAHTGEDASEPYLQMIDGFMTWRWIQTNPIPLFQSIYSGRIQFTGKIYNHQNPGVWESNFAKAASQVVYGEQLGWLTLEDLEAATPFRKYFKVLSFVRKALLEYFNCGQMAAPIKFSVPPKMVTLNWGESSKRRAASMVTNPVIMNSSWILPDNRKMMLFINTTDEIQKATVKLDKKDKYFYICKQNSSQAKAVKTAPQLNLKPYGVEVWLISPVDNRKEANLIAQILHRTSKFDEGKSLSVKKIVKQQAPKEIKPQVAKLVPITLAAKYTNTFKRYYGNGYDNDTVLILYNGSTIIYNNVDMKKSIISLVVAYDTSEKGGKFDLVIDGKIVGTAKLEQPGKYLEFKNLDIYKNESFTGKKNLEIRFTGKSCRIKGFKVKNI